MKRILKNQLLPFLIIIIFSFLFFNNSSAQNLKDAQSNLTITGIGIGYNTATSPEVFIGGLIKIALSLIGIFFLILIIISGYQWMSAGGNDESIGKAKKRIINSTIGLAIVLGAYAITYYIVYYLSKETINPRI